LYLRKIFLKNIRSFEELTIDLQSAQSLSTWALILGDNGVGKTSVLRCIAMGMCDATSASALLKEIPGDMIRENAQEAKIELDLIDNVTSEEYSIKTRLTRSSSGDVNVDQVPSDSFPWEKVFVCGYGAGRSAYGTEDYDRYSTVNSVYSLFNYESSLQNPELVLRRLKDEIEIEEILLKLDAVMMLPEHSTRLTRSGLTISGPWGSFKPSGSLGDGYQAALGLVGDLIGWWGMFHEEGVLTAELEGVVLVDELEQHLHPRWQQSITKLLHDQFPKIQFIVTTHSPLCAIGASDLSAEETELVWLRQAEGYVEGFDDQKAPGRQRADQVLTSYLFGLDSTRGTGVTRDINRYANLKSKKNRDPAEQQELIELHSRLDRDLGSEETELQRLVQNAVRKTLEKLPEEIASVQPDPDIVDLEIKRQLKGLFDSTPTK
jgi:predicted ATPase